MRTRSAGGVPVTGRGSAEGRVGRPVDVRDPDLDPPDLVGRGPVRLAAERCARASACSAISSSRLAGRLLSTRAARPWAFAAWCSPLVGSGALVLLFAIKPPARAGYRSGTFSLRAPRGPGRVSPGLPAGPGDR